MLKAPVANTSPEAVELRKNAIDFGKDHLVQDSNDTAGQIRNRTLLQSAVQYAKTADILLTPLLLSALRLARQRTTDPTLIKELNKAIREGKNLLGAFK